VTGHCQRCGRACEGALCRPCQAIVATLQTKERNRQFPNPERKPELKELEGKPGQRQQQPTSTKKGSAANPQHRRLSSRQARPPGVVVQTFEAVGSLQLHRFSRRVRFYCVTCMDDKRGDLIATTKGDWKQAVCDRCYAALVRKPQGQARKKAAKRTPQASQTVRDEQLKRRNGPPTEPATARVQSKPFTMYRLSGIDSMLEFFRSAGVDARLGPAGRLWIDDIQVEHLARVPPPETTEWINTVNEIVLKYIRDKFIRAVEANAPFGADLDASFLPREKGIAIMRGDDRLAVIHPAHASIARRRFIYANFLTAGPHWQQVANVLRDAEVKSAAGAKHGQKAKPAKKAAWRYIDRLPDDVAPELIGACLDASRRIRLDRQHDYGDSPVVLECDVGELTLLPIAGAESRLFVPFRLSKGTETLKGELILADRDPLPVRIGKGVADKDAIPAWTCALLGFADATCIAFDLTGPTARRELARPRWPPHSSTSRRRPSVPALPAKLRWPSYLEPVGHTVRYVNSIVRGHRRRLPDGHKARDAQHDLARRIGIILRPNETWVSPHTRGHGLPDGTERRFVWHAPAELKLLR
jgi:hypothetical protein